MTKFDPTKTIYREIELEDCGQDFTKWTIDENGIVVDAQPFQANIWIGTKIVNHYELRVGSTLFCKFKTLDSVEPLEYHVMAITEPETKYAFWQFPFDAGKRNECRGRTM